MSIYISVYKIVLYFLMISNKLFVLYYFFSNIEFVQLIKSYSKIYL